MPQFEYKARHTDGRIVKGTIDTVDRRQAAQRLSEQKLTPVTLKEVTVQKKSKLGGLLDKTRSLKNVGANKSTPETNTSNNISGKSPRRESVGLTFLQRLLELHSAGLPIGDSIRILSQRLSDPEQKQLATTLWRDLSEGATLAGAIARQPKYYSSSTAYVIEAGEATGSLAPILKKVIAALEEKQAIRKKMLSSMAYPAFICTVAFAVVLLFLFFLLPQIQNMLSKLGGEMTWSAQIVISGSAYLVQFGPFILIALGVMAAALAKWRKTEKGLLISDRWYLKLPLLGKIFYYSDLFQTGNLVSTLLESGINTTETLRLTERTIQNSEMRERFHIARNQVNEGLSIAQAFRRNQFMPDLAVDILTVGENTGNLSSSMNEITKGFREELSKRLSLLTTIVSSGALIAAFLMVGLIAMGIVTSVFQVSKTLSV